MSAEQEKKLTVAQRHAGARLSTARQIAGEEAGQDAYLDAIRETPGMPDGDLPTGYHALRDHMGILRLRVGVRAGKSIATEQYHRGAMKIIRPHYLDDSGQVYYTLVLPGGGYLGGDDYHMNIAACPEASLLLSGQAATKVYRTPGDYAQQDMNIILGENAVFEYIPDQLIMYRGASYRQHMQVNMHPSASFLTAEIITPGWSPEGSDFSYDECTVRTAVSFNGEIKVVDVFCVRPKDETTAGDQLLLREENTHIATLTAIDQRIDENMVKHIRDIMNTYVDTAPEPVICGVSSTPNVNGLSIRALGTRTEDLYGLIIAIASELRGLLRGQGKIVLRKY